MQLGRLKDRQTSGQAARRTRRIEKRRAARGQAWVSPTERAKAEKRPRKPLWVRVREMKAGRQRAQVFAVTVWQRIQALASRSERALRCPHQHELRTAAGLITGLSEPCGGRLKVTPVETLRCQTCGRDWKRLSPKAATLARVA